MWLCICYPKLLSRIISGYEDFMAVNKASTIFVINAHPFFFIIVVTWVKLYKVRNTNNLHSRTSSTFICMKLGPRRMDVSILWFFLLACFTPDQPLTPPPSDTYYGLCTTTSVTIRSWRLTVGPMDGVQCMLLGPDQPWSATSTTPLSIRCISFAILHHNISRIVVRYCDLSQRIAETDNKLFRLLSWY